MAWPGSRRHWPRNDRLSTHGHWIVRPLLAALLLGLTACHDDPAPAGPRASGGAALLSAALSAPATVVGRVARVARIDRHGYRAQLEVERSLCGAFASGTQLEIAWEELAAGREARFANGEQVLVALDALPGGSLWLNRFPPPLRDGRAFVVAASGEAFLRNPDAATIASLTAYLAVPADQRAAASAIDQLARVVQQATPVVALAAVTQLNATNGLTLASDSAAASSLGSVLSQEDKAVEIRSAVLQLVGQRRLSALRPAVAKLAESSSPLQATAISTLAALDNGLPTDSVLALLASPQGSLRAAGVRAAQGATLDDKVAPLVVSDPDPEVRLAAVEALIAHRGAAALPKVMPALADSAPKVRSATANAIAQLGEAVVPGLEQFAMSGGVAQAEGAILALDRLGASGAEALRHIGAQHPDDQVRRVAALALGQPSKEK